MKNYSMLLDVTPAEFNVVKFVYEILEDKIKSFKLEETYYWDFKDDFEKTLEKEYHYTLGSGLSKMVLIPLNGDRVIKFPYQRYNGEVLTGAINNNSCSSWNYCAVEEFIGSEAEEDGMGFIFAKTKKCMEIDGYPIYCQPKCITLAQVKYALSNSDAYDSCFEITMSLHRQNENFYSSGEFKAMDKIICDFAEKNKQYFYSSLDSIGIDWYCAVKKFYNGSIERIFDLIKYFHDREITDLHPNNIGFTLSGQPVLIDYSGFNEHSDSYSYSDFSYNSSDYDYSSSEEY